MKLTSCGPASWLSYLACVLAIACTSATGQPKAGDNDIGAGGAGGTGGTAGTTPGNGATTDAAAAAGGAAGKDAGPSADRSTNTGGAAGSAGVDAGPPVGPADGPRDQAPAVDPAKGDGGPVEISTTMSFFVTSRGMGKGGNLGGLEGADMHCKTLAAAVSPALGAKTWHAYLSTSTVNANTRIGPGPWRNAKGVIVASSLEVLHADQGPGDKLSATWPMGYPAFEIILDEKGGKHQPNLHDMLTGSRGDGTVDIDHHCSNWTSSSGIASVGHSNREGDGLDPSWNFVHTVGCGSELDAGGKLVNRISGTVTSGGGRGSFYCFATP